MIEKGTERKRERESVLIQMKYHL